MSWYGSDNPGTLTNLARLLNHGALAGTGRLNIYRFLRDTWPQGSFRWGDEVVIVDDGGRAWIATICS